MVAYIPSPARNASKTSLSIRTGNKHIHGGYVTLSVQFLKEAVMERTALETHRDAFGCENIQFETVQDATVRLGGGTGTVDRETLAHCFCINVEAKAYVEADNGFTRPVHIQVWITPTQLADIVKEFFVDFLRHVAPVYRSMLERILRKRWSVMTSGIFKEEFPGTRRVEPYYKIRP
jgi:hypothetical protein